MVIAHAEATESQTSNEATAEEKIMALLTSKQFGVIYDTPYQGGEEKIIALLQRCESLIDTITHATNPAALEAAIQIADACLIPALPAAEVRNLVRTIVEKDVTLVTHMPQLRKILWRVYRAIELSLILDPKVLSRIAADIANQRQWGSLRG
jgi:hypothetical protein